ncbi:5-formyltetrahydrofolate cyclo-ligase [Pseudonocardiaceae bacterium YIM PH 21723]|nr:5-formyltetrahydrofolate cyclo-ligase [Pseudonocardiaceae bacterium YIM PH 21723]
MTDKTQWRKELLAARKAVSPQVATAEATSLLRGAVDLVQMLRAKLVCAYVPMAAEPGDIRLLDSLRAAGVRVLLPLASGEEPLDWAEYTGEDSLAPGPFKILEPIGDRLGQAAVGTAQVVFIPALAVDRRGVRLGRGAGHYDRSLEFATATSLLIAVVRDEEIVPELPVFSHDVRVDGVLTPSGGVEFLR